MSLEKRESLMSTENPLPGLGSASCQSLEYTQITKAYSSGASYVGQVCGNKRAGRGVFTWPNGAKYEGEFLDNVREGQGVQTWQDGSQYEGSFSNDVRHGNGKHRWANGESYEGIFYKDRRHGSGRYTWSDGSSYSGTFFMDRKEGYGCFTFTDGRTFKGLYKDDERFGPGVMTYPDGRQDVGMWYRDHLSRLCMNIEGAFKMSDHPEFDYCPDEHKTYIRPETMSNRNDLVRDLLSPPADINYEPSVNISQRSSELFHAGLHEKSVAVDIKSCHEQLEQNMKDSRPESPGRISKSPVNILVSDSKGSVNYVESGIVSSGNLGDKSVEMPNSAIEIVPSKGRPKSAKSQRIASAKSDRSKSRPKSSKSQRIASAKSQQSKSSQKSASSGRSDRRQKVVTLDERLGILAWNSSPSSIEVQKHVMRHSLGKTQLDFNVDNILNGERSGFGERGPLEEAAESFIKAACSGNVKEVGSMLHHGKVHVDVADKAGFTALIGASVNWHEDVINCLLDNGADVNRLSDEGISALAACHVFFYPVDAFQYNIAEHHLDKSGEIATQPSSDTIDNIKSILSNAQKKKQSLLEKKSQNLVDTKRIQALREEYSSLECPIDPNTEEHDLEKVNTENDIQQGLRRISVNQSADRQLGTLKVKRRVRINIEEMLDPSPRPLGSPGDQDFNSDCESVSSANSFQSQNTARNFPIDVTDQLIERCATGLSANHMVVSRARVSSADMKTVGTVRRLAMEKAHRQLMELTIRLLLRRGADPNASKVPMPVLFFAVKAADVDAVKRLLDKGASTATKLSVTKGGLTALHIAAAMPGEEGVQMVALLLNALADPDARAVDDDSFLNRNLEEEWSKDSIDDFAREILGGRTPLHIACARDDNYKHACSVVHLLLDHHANPNLMCNGNSPLALTIRSGNDLALDELLNYHADPCLPLTHGVGSALCVASSTEYEHRRSPDGRIYLIDKLIAAGADILAPIPIGPKRLIGTAVDYAYHLYNLDRRIAYMPYHALTPVERDTFNARRNLLAHLGDIMREKATEKERERLKEEKRLGRQSRSPSPNFTYTGAGASVPSKVDSKVNFSEDVRKPLFKYCYECGRSVGMRLSPCTRCKEVYYCSKACKIKAWISRHKEECIRIKGSSPQPLRTDRRIDSPTPATDADKGKQHTVKGISSRDQRIKDQFFNSGSDLKNFSQIHVGEMRGGKYHHKGRHDWGNLGEFGERFNDQLLSKSARVRGQRTNQGQTNQRSHSARVNGLRDHVLVGRKQKDHGVNYKGQGHIYSNHNEVRGQGRWTGAKFSEPARQVPFKGHSLSSRGKRQPPPRGPITVMLPNGKLMIVNPANMSVGDGRISIILPNGKMAYMDNYSYV